jgi:hypothetical protein
MKKSDQKLEKSEQIQSQFSRLESLSQSFAHKIEEMKKEQEVFKQQMKQQNLFCG